MEKLLKFMNTFDVDSLQRKECLAYVIKTATSNAKQGEDLVKAKRDKAWRKHVAGQPNKCGKGTYLYAKGVLGTHNSPLEDSEGECDYDVNGTLDSDDSEVRSAVSKLPNDPFIERGISGTLSDHDTGQDTGKRCKPSGLQGAVEAEAKAWARLWRVGCSCDFEQIIPPENQHPGAITAQMV